MEQNLDLMEEKYGLMVKIMFYLKRRVGLMNEKWGLTADKWGLIEVKCGLREEK